MQPVTDALDGGVIACLCWCRGGGSLPIPTRGCSLLTLAFQVASVALQGVGLELLEHLGAIQKEELVLDGLSNSPIELTI